VNGFQRIGSYLRWTFLPLFLCDSAALACAGVLAYWLRTSELFWVHPYLQNPREYLFLLALALFLWHATMAFFGGYADRSLIFRIDELLIQFKSSITVFLLLMSATFLYKGYDYSRLILFFSWLFFVLLGSLFRQVAHRLKTAFFLRGRGRRRVLLVGHNPRRDSFEKRILENPSLGIDIVPLPAAMTPETFLGQEFIAEVFWFEEVVSYEKVWMLRTVSLNPGIVVHLIPPFGNLYLRNISGGFFDGTLMIRYDSPLDRTFTLAAKRLIDLGVGLVFFVLLSPITLILAALIRLDSPGPIFFRQKRIGLAGNPFTIWKFRSMFVDVDPYAETPTDRRDPRITRMGAFLRSTGLDELPQLWNVIIGDMSLVGPRPEMPFIVEEYSDLEKKRLQLRPGITGLWQIYARSNNLPIHRNIEYDLYYIENVSLSLDVMILLDTIPTMVLRSGI
jgi:exopolysaccharide biosynthesis polyprenyl glycosylphosphotransferase